MSDKPTKLPPPDPLAPRLVTIASSVTPSLRLSASTYPQATGGPVTFSKASADGFWQPFSWWVLNPVTSDRSVFQILFFPSGGHLCLDVGGTTAGSKLQLKTVTPSSQSQLWLLDDSKTSAQHILNRGISGTEFGFPHDIPLEEMDLELLDSPETNASGDAFVISSVSLSPT